MNSYRSVLLELSNGLTTSDLQELKFLCGDVIPAGSAERITRGFELFGALEQRNMLSEENRDFLASKLIAIKRIDLRNKLLGIQGDQGVVGQTPATVPIPTDLDNSVISDTLIHDLVEELSTSWKMLGRRLGIPEAALTNIDFENRRVIEKGMAVFSEWKRRRVNEATLRVLREALEKIGRRDLSEKVRDFVLSEQQRQMNTPMETGSPVEERRPFPNLNDLGSALPYVPPPTTSNTLGQREPQEQGDRPSIPIRYQTPVLLHTAASNQLPSQGTSASLPREPHPVPASGTEQGDRPSSLTRYQPPVLLHTAASNQPPSQGTSASLPREPHPVPASGTEQGDRPSSLTRYQPPVLLHTAASNQPPSQGTSASLPREPHPVPASGTEQGDRPSSLTRYQPPVLLHTAASNQPPSQGTSASLPREPHPVPASGTEQGDRPSSLTRYQPPVLLHTAASNQPPSQGTSASLPREPHPVPASGTEFNGQDFTDHGPEQRTGTGIQVESSRTRIELGLDRDGSFLDPEKYEPVKLLGSGGFAKVYLVVRKATGNRMACKMCDLGVNHHETQKQVKAVSAEVRALSAVKHRYIVELYHLEEIRHTLLLFLEYMEGGSVEDLLRLKGPMQESLVKKFTWQLLTAVEFLHANGIIHKDIKGGNILLDEPQKNIKLADFGICTVMNQLKTATGGLVTKNNIASFHWTSPELLASKPFGRNTDIWSVGCTVVEMLTTKPPLLQDSYKHLDMPQRMYKIVHLEVEPPTECSSLAFGFLKRCLCKSDIRPSASKLLESDAFLKDPLGQ